MELFGNEDFDIVVLSFRMAEERKIRNELVFLQRIERSLRYQN